MLLPERLPSGARGRRISRPQTSDRASSTRVPTSCRSGRDDSVARRRHGRRGTGPDRNGDDQLDGGTLPAITGVGVLAKYDPNGSYVWASVWRRFPAITAASRRSGRVSPSAARQHHRRLASVSSRRNVWVAKFTSGGALEPGWPITRPVGPSSELACRWPSIGHGDAARPRNVRSRLQRCGAAWARRRRL